MAQLISRLSIRPFVWVNPLGAVTGPANIPGRLGIAYSRPFTVQVPTSPFQHVSAEQTRCLGMRRSTAIRNPSLEEAEARHHCEGSIVVLMLLCGAALALPPKAA